MEPDGKGELTVATMVEKLKRRVGDSVAALFTDEYLTDLLADVATEYALDVVRHPMQALDLAQANICMTMASDTARYFKYSQGSESVDKTSTPAEFRMLANALLAKYPNLSVGGASSVALAVPKEFVEGIEDARIVNGEE